MRRMMKLTFLLPFGVIILVCLSVMIGCSKTYEGKYVNTENPGRSLELRPNGEFLIDASSFKVKAHGKYEVLSNDKILFKFPNGEAMEGIIRQNGKLIELSNSEFGGSWKK